MFGNRYKLTKYHRASQRELYSLRERVSQSEREDPVQNLLLVISVLVIAASWMQQHVPNTQSRHPNTEDGRELI